MSSASAPDLQRKAAQICHQRQLVTSEGLQVLTIHDQLGHDSHLDHYHLLRESQPALVSFSSWLPLAVEPTSAA